MHELGLTRNIIAIVAEHAAGRPVQRVRLAIGPHACVEREALRFCFRLLIEATPLTGAALDFTEADGDTFLVKDYELKEVA